MAPEGSICGYAADGNAIVKPRRRSSFLVLLEDSIGMYSKGDRIEYTVRKSTGRTDIATIHSFIGKGRSKVNRMQDSPLPEVTYLRRRNKA